MDDEEVERLRARNTDLEARLHEAEDTLAAIRSGDVDALIVGEDVYTLDSAQAASNAMRKDVLAQMQDAVLAFDNDDHLIFMNPAAETQYGCMASQMLGRLRSELYQERWSDDELARRSARALRDHGSYRAESMHVRGDGIELYVESTVAQLNDSHGQLLGTLWVIRDIGERVHAQARLAEASIELARRERQFATLVENSPDVFARMDRALRHLYVSPVIERYTGMPASAFLGKSNSELGMPPAIVAEWDPALRRVFETGAIDQVQFRFTAANGQAVEFEARLIPEFAEDGTIESVLSIASDITARKLAEAALRDADARKDEFLATLAHELRNPLAPIRNAVQIMQLSRDEGVHENARRVVERQLKQLVHLVDDLLDIGRISQGKVDLRRESVDVASVVMTAIETSRPLIDAGHHELTLRLGPARALRVNADVTRLCQIVANLLNNAAKYTPEGGHIEVSVEREGDHAMIRVRDSGIGIQKEMLPRVFDMFAQVDRSMERSQGGLGIGLALVKRLVEMHGGSVAASSDGPNRGSCFVIRLPLFEHAREFDVAARTSQLAPGIVGRQRVLVADDNIDSVQSLSEMLSILGFEITVAHDGVEAVEAVRLQSPEVAVLDIGMPRMNGLEAARAIRTLPMGEHIVLIALSGWGQEQDRGKSSAAGFDHHFVKPLDVEALIEVIGRPHPR